MPAFPSSGFAPLRALALALAAAGALAGCQALGGGGGGVMPASDVGLPPSMRDAVPGKPARAASVDADTPSPQAAPTRQLALPKSAGASARTADASERRIRREEIEGNDEARRSGSSIAPAMTPGGGMGVGGKF